MGNSNSEHSISVRKYFFWGWAIVASAIVILGFAWPGGLEAQSQAGPHIQALGLGFQNGTNLSNSATTNQGGVPDAPDRPTGAAVFIGGVDLEWNEVPGADSYDVRLYTAGQWVVLPGGGVDIAFYGPGAIISGLDPNSTLWFQVRAENSYGSSEWSAYNSMPSTNQHTLGRRERPENAAATGAPVISGTAEVGETLSSDTEGIEDANGLDRVDFRYQWLSNDGVSDTVITDARDSSYTLVAADEGNTIKLRVNFTDRGGYSETLTSTATASVLPEGEGTGGDGSSQNSPATGSPTISGSAQVGETLTAGTSGIADSDGLTNVSYGYQWISNDGNSDTDIAGATNSTYTLVAADEGNTIKVRVSFTDDGGNEETLTSAATSTVAPKPNSVATGSPTISGTAQVGETLTADTSGIVDSDGLTNVSYSYQWISNDGTSDTDITGATDSTYTLVAADEGNTIKVMVSFTDDAENDETLTSAATSAVAPKPNRVATGSPTISGTAQVGETLTADTSGIVDSDGLTNVSYSYQWISNDGNTDTEIAGATGSSYTLVAADEGNTIKVKVSFTDDEGNSESLTSTATASVISEGESGQGGSPNSPATGAPTISGTAQVGETLTADTFWIADSDGLTNVSYGYQWISSDGDSDTDITGATGSSYTPVADDEGKTIKVKVSFTDDADNDETLTSTATGTVAADQQDARVPSAPSEVWALSDEDGVTLQWTKPTEGDDPTGYQILRRVGGSGDFEVYVEDTETIVTIHLDTSVEQNEWYEYKIRAINEVALGLESSILRVQHQHPTPIQEETAVKGASQGVEMMAYETPKNESTPVAHETIYVVMAIAFSPAAWGVSIDINPLTPDVDTSTTDYIINFRLVDSVGNFQTTCEGNGFGGSVHLTTVPAEQNYSHDAEMTCDGIIRVEVLDGDGNFIYRYDLVRPNSSATGAPTITGTAQVGETLTAEVSDIVDADGLTNASFSYQWISIDDTTETDIAGATGSTYTLVAADEGKAIKVKVTFTDDLYNGETLTSAATVSVLAAGEGASGQGSSPNSPATGAPTISGTAQVGETLTADTSGIADSDGLTNVSYSYQWISNDGNSDTDITAATGSSYNLVAADEGNTIKVKVSFTDDEGNSESLTSTATASVISEGEGASGQGGSLNSLATGAPTISGTAQVGETLTADTSGIADSDGLTDVSYSYQWISNDGNTDTDITNATGSSYTLVAADEGNTIKVRVSFTDDEGNSESLTSTATASVLSAGEGAMGQGSSQNSPATGAPTISGSAQVGETLTAGTSGIADSDGLTNVSYGYQWISNDGTSDTDITGATDSTYTLVAADEGNIIKVGVSFKDDADNDETLTSTATEAVAKPPLTASFENVPVSHDGETAFTVELRFSESPDLGFADVRDHVLTVIDGEVASARRLERPSNIRWEVKITPASDSGVTVTLPVTTDCADSSAVCTDDNRKLISLLTVTIPGPPQNMAATGLPTISGTAQVGDTLTASTSGIADADGLTSVSYNYQWIRIVGSDDVDIHGATNSTYTLVAADEGKTIKVRVNFTDDANNEEILTSAATAAVAAAPSPLTVSLTNQPADHNGTDKFTFEIRFSEEFSLSYATLRDEAFTLEGGTVTSAGRQVQGSNIGWTITVKPDSNADVEIVLPTTTDCGANGAICTQDGRKLSNRLEFTVSGPGN